MLALANEALKIKVLIFVLKPFNLKYKFDKGTQGATAKRSILNEKPENILLVLVWLCKLSLHLQDIRNPRPQFLLR